jgi:hypothetical protein
MSRRTLPTPENLQAKSEPVENTTPESSSSSVRARRDLPTPLEGATPQPSNKTELDPSAFVKDLSERATRGEEIDPSEIQRFQQMMTNVQRNPNQAQNVRNMLEGDELMEKMLQSMSGKKNVHGNQQPSRKKVLKAQKNAKKMMKATQGSEQSKPTANFKAIRITRSRQVKSLTLNGGNEVGNAMTALSSVDETTAYQWGEELIVITKPKCGHMRNKLVESIFSRDAMFGDEVIVLRIGKDTTIDQVKQLAKTAKKAEPYVPPEPEPEPEEEIPDLVEAEPTGLNEETRDSILDEKIQNFREQISQMSPQDLSHITDRVASIIDEHSPRSEEKVEEKVEEK